MTTDSRANDPREEMRKNIVALYQREHAALGEKGTLDLLERGRAWDLSSTLSAGGVVVFPHGGGGRLWASDCGGGSCCAR